MPIKVTCACGQSFAAKDELAGRTLKCPKCGQPLPIPAAQAPASATQAPLAATQPMPASYPPPMGPAPAQQGAPTPNLFDEVGLKATPVGTFPCPGCGEGLPPNAVLCIKCGYNLRIGRRMETMRMGGGEGGGGPVTHAEVTATLLNRAAQSIEDEKLEEKKKVREGLPWWAYLVMLLFVVGFMAGMMMIPQAQAMFAAGIILMIAANLLSFFAWIRVLIIAFTESPLHGFLSIFVPFYILVYIIMRWSECSAFFFMWLGSIAIAALGFGVLLLAAIFADDTPVGLLPLLREGVPAVLTMTGLA